MLSTFSYSRFKCFLLSRARKKGVDVYRVDPAYTSIIGAFKFVGYKHLSTHQRAALAIARRARRYSERPSLYLGPCSAESMDLGSSQTAYLGLYKGHDGSKGFWKSNGKKIRELIPDDRQPSWDKTPINPNRLSGVKAFLGKWKNGPSCPHPIYRVLSGWWKYGGVSPGSV